jgi:hypothetical protein
MIGFEKCHQGVAKQEGEGRSDMIIKWKLSEVNTRAVSRGQNELIGKFKIEKDICDCQSISNKFLPVCVCLSSRDLFISR